MKMLLTMCLILKNGLKSCLYIYIHITESINKHYKLHLENTRSGY